MWSRVGWWMISLHFLDIDKSEWLEDMVGRESVQ